jgi:hypothetical protein
VNRSNTRRPLHDVPGSAINELREAGTIKGQQYQVETVMGSGVDCAQVRCRSRLSMKYHAVGE